MNVILQSFKEVVAAGQYKPIYAYAELLTILSNSASADIYVGIGEMTPTLLKAGIQYKLPQGDTFNKILLYNQAGTDTTIEFILSTGDVRDNRMSVSGQIDVKDGDVLGQLQGDTTAEGYGRVTVGTAAVAVAAVNNNRKGIDIQADPDNTNFIYLGYDNTVASNKWFAKLAPGQAFSRDNIRSAIYAISGAANQYCGYGEV